MATYFQPQTTDPGAVFDSVIEQWRGRCKCMAYRLGSRQRYEAQAEFFAGAMSVMLAQGVDHAKAMPPGIVLMIMGGRDILAEKDGEDYRDEDDQDEES